MNITKFLSLNSIFGSKNRDMKKLEEQVLLKEVNQVEQEIQAIEKEIAYFIEADKLNNLNEYLEAGARLSVDTLHQIFIKRADWFNNFGTTKSTEKLNSLISTHYAEEMVKILESCFTAFAPRNLMTEIEKEPYNSRIVKTPSFEKDQKDEKQKLFSQALDGLDVASRILKTYPNTFSNHEGIYKAFNDNKEFMRQALVNPQSYDFVIWSSQIDLLNRRINTFEEIMKKQFSLLEKSEISKKIATIQKLYRQQNPVESLQANLKTSLTQKISTIDKNSMPPEAWKIIENIQNTGIELIKHTDKLSQEDNFNIKNLTQKVLFEVIQSYVSVLPEFKEKLVSHDGKNIDTLFIESLNKIETQLKDKLEVVAEAQFKEVKTQHQYLSGKR